MSDPELDQIAGAPHPRNSLFMAGHLEAEQHLSEGVKGARAHHAWLLTGPKGVGKATLAYRAVRYLLGARVIGPRPFDVHEADPVTMKVGALCHPDLFVLRRQYGDRGKARRDIGVDEARDLGRFLSMQPSEGGWRVAVIDSVDELNRNAANAILKTIEEPPPRTLLLLICHSPGSALATIRSRCRRLRLQTLPDQPCKDVVQRLSGKAPSDLVLQLAKGSPGKALALLAHNADDLWQTCLAATRECCAGNGKPEAFAPLAPGASLERFQLLLAVTCDIIRMQAAREPAAGLGALPAAPESLARAWTELIRLREQTEALGLDPSHAVARIGVVLDQQLRHGHAPT